MTDLSDSKIVLYSVREGISLNHRPPTPVRVRLHLFLLDVRRSALSLAFLRDKAEARAPCTHSAYAVRAVGARAPPPRRGALGTSWKRLWPKAPRAARGESHVWGLVLIGRNRM